MPRGPKGERPPPISAVAALTVRCPLAGPRSTRRPVKAEVVKMRLDPKWPLRCQSTAESIQRLLSAGVPPRGISVERRSGYASIRHRHFCKEWSSSPSRIFSDSELNVIGPPRLNPLLVRLLQPVSSRSPKRPMFGILLA
jgi:hypothetical protein